MVERKIDLNTITLWGEDIHFQIHLDGQTARIAIARPLLLSIRPDPSDHYLNPERLLLSKFYDVVPAIDAAARSTGGAIGRVTMDIPPRP